jgi:hypothetical protein
MEANQTLLRFLLVMTGARHSSRTTFVFSSLPQAAATPRSFSMHRGLAGRQGSVRGPWCTRVATGLFRPLRLAGSAPPPSKEPREDQEQVSLPVPPGEMSRNETEGVLE